MFSCRGFNTITGKDKFLQNVRHIKFDWFGQRMKDPLIVAMIAACSNLETLEIYLGRTCSDGSYSRQQRLHQGDNSIRMFNRTNGFDKLISLRGIKKVIVKRAPEFLVSVTKAEVETFEKFLIEKLTTPVAQPAVSSPISEYTRINCLSNHDKGLYSHIFDPNKKVNEA